MNDRAEEQLSKLSQGMVPIGVVDKNGRQLHQYESVLYDDTDFMILWSRFRQKFTAMDGEGAWLEEEGMSKAEYVLITTEEDWEQLETSPFRLALDRLTVSHHNMNSMLNEAIRALEKIAEETEDEATKAFASSKVGFLNSLVPDKEQQSPDEGPQSTE